MRIFKSIENGIEYDAIECVGPLEYVDGKCFVFDHKVGSCIMFYMENSMYSNTPSGGVSTLHFKEYYKNRELHRDNGPAIENFDAPNRSKYYLEGVPMDAKKYKIKLRKYKIRQLNLIQSEDENL